MIHVFLQQAVACIGMVCHPVLVGDSTPTGTYPLVAMESPEHGRVLAFARDDAGAVFAMHSIPSQRQQLIASRTRTSVTRGCINAPPAVMDAAGREQRITIHGR